MITYDTLPLFADKDVHRPRAKSSKNMTAIKLLAIVKQLTTKPSFLDSLVWTELPEYRKIRLAHYQGGQTLIEFGAGKTLLAGMINIEFMVLAKHISDHRNDLDADGWQSYLLPAINQDGVMFKTLSPDTIRKLTAQEAVTCK